MRARQPSLWLMTDERMGEALWDALERLPHHAGVVFRHYATPLPERRRLWARVRGVCRRRGLVLVRAGGERLGRRPELTHGAQGALTWPAHDRRQAVAAARAGARVVFVSPIFPTRSHPRARTLGPLRAATIARGLPVSAVALGGMDARRWQRLRGLGFAGWAAIDALTPRHHPAKAGSHSSTGLPSASWTRAKRPA